MAETPDGLSRQHLKRVWAEIQGRFFSPDEAEILKQTIDVHTFSDPIIRAEAAKCWEPETDK